nr:hypothetical protein [Tanacetum cinerariifolium]
MINFIDITCKDRFPEVLKFNKSNHPSSNSTTPLSDSSPSPTPFGTSVSLLEEFANELALLDPFAPGKEDNNFDFETDLREIEFLLKQDPSTEYNIETINPILEKFTDEPSLDYLPPPGDDNNDDDDLFKLKSDNDKWKNLYYSIMTQLFLRSHLRLLLCLHLPLEMRTRSDEDFSLLMFLLQGQRNSGIAPDYEDSRAYGFVHRLLELLSLEYLYMGIRYLFFEWRLNPFVEIPYGEIKVHIEVLSVSWGNRLPIPDGSLPLSR